MKHYPAGFKADAVSLYRLRPGARVKFVATDLGVDSETLRNWVRAADGRLPGTHSSGPAAARDGGDDVQAELAAARKRNRELEEERGILRKAARYFATEALVNRCQFVDHQPRFGVKRLCGILGLPRSSFYHWRLSSQDHRRTPRRGLPGVPPQAPREDDADHRARGSPPAPPAPHHRRGPCSGEGPGPDRPRLHRGRGQQEVPRRAQ
ncbi:transposase [Streptomyces sp. NPDC017943]|uniref:transposase n=1 Tax=Streptomyces sp. NPDC017943 TaxID=3365019 RepID=UPI0037B9FC6B